MFEIGQMVRYYGKLCMITDLHQDVFTLLVVDEDATYAVNRHNGETMKHITPVTRPTATQLAEMRSYRARMGKKMYRMVFLSCFPGGPSTLKTNEHAKTLIGNLRAKWDHEMKTYKAPEPTKMAKSIREMKHSLKALRQKARNGPNSGDGA